MIMIRSTTIGLHFLQSSSYHDTKGLPTVKKPIVERR